MTDGRTAEALIDRARTIVREQVVPIERDFLAGGGDRARPALDAVRERVREEGLLAPHLPPEVGGRGLSLAAFGRLSEELGWSPLGHYAFNCQAPDVGNMELLLRHGNAEQKERLLKPLAEGRIRSCFAMTEPDRAGSNPAWLGTTATADGDGYVLDGRKWFVSSADGAAFAVVVAVTRPEAPPHARATLFAVPTDTPGFRLLRNIPVMGERGAGYFSHGEVALDGCRVPSGARIGAEGSGFALAQERLGPGRIHHALRWIGVCARALHMTCERAARRELAPGVPLGSKQAVQHAIAESRAEIDAARLLVLRTAEKIDAEGTSAARVDISLVKFHVAGVLDRVLDRAVQVHGALGLTDDTVLAFWYRHERAARIYDGPDEVHKSVVARHLLRAHGVDVEI
ncbi:MAG TPA: acyl-CoA dehydrogenase family protein [Vicinamibacteria bacterium]|nr:acyl-CoA dehydrogenase family protein [Vicinamibacteria bacterium]